MVRNDKKELIMRFIYFVFSLCFLMACGEDPSFTPKPRAYPKVEYPEKTFEAFTEASCPFTFTLPSYAKVVRDTSFFNEKPENPCWFDLYIPAFDSRLHCTYSPIDKDKTFLMLKEESFRLADWHNKRANYIDEINIKNANGVSGFAFDIRGPAASPFQFYLTDSTHHFLRAALYFNTQVQPDSLAPIYEFVKADLLTMIETFQWK